MVYTFSAFLTPLVGFGTDLLKRINATSLTSSYLGQPYPTPILSVEILDQGTLARLGLPNLNYMKPNPTKSDLTFPEASETTKD